MVQEFTRTWILITIHINQFNWLSYIPQKFIKFVFLIIFFAMSHFDWPTTKAFKTQTPLPLPPKEMTYFYSILHKQKNHINIIILHLHECK